MLLLFLLITLGLKPFRQQEDNLMATLANVLLLCAFLGTSAGSRPSAHTPSDLAPLPPVRHNTAWLFGRPP